MTGPPMTGPPMTGWSDIEVRVAGEPDRSWARSQLEKRWLSTTIVSRGSAHDAGNLPALVATAGGRRVGLVTFRFGDGDCELVTLDSLEPGRGVGTALVHGVLQEGRRRGCSRMWLVTSNDNLGALGFYQRRGFRLVSVYPGAVDEARKLKPSIPMVGEHGIEVHDELELEIRLRPGQPAPLLG
ncbi:MAG TPA: GNAT family N-acetyltransferase [Acidimicrobiales bacterium]|nr:GNAT family N-acetyltransferase [Acidimicrobiales bacterium]